MHPDDLNPLFNLEIRLIHAKGPKKGEIAKTIQVHNVVTSWQSSGGVAPTSGRDLMRRILVPDTFPGSLAGDADATISEIRLGSGTTAETPADTALDEEIAGSDKALDDVEFDPDYPYVTFVFEYLDSEMNQTLSEAGLFSGRGDFVARKTFGAFTKTDDYSLQFRWEIRF